MDILLYGMQCEKTEEHIAAYRLLELVLRREFGIKQLPAMERGARGKPYFPQYPQIQFNLSHSYGAVVCVVHDQPIGVDIEKIRRAPARLAHGMEDRLFFREWTAKEATVKQRGQGIAHLMRGGVIDKNCITLEDFMDGWIVTVCPADESNCIVSAIVIDSAFAAEI
ncbi:MAG: hypothetical protein IJ955_06600 [Oscillospiraceae bacterium]|nr:hypothetical protein [Oscillospiraceae bacterium]